MIKWESIKELENYNEDLLTELFLLQNEINKLKNKRKYDLCFIKHLKEDKKELQQRIDKAIEYIKDYIEDYAQPIQDNDVIEIYYKGVKELLEILGGGENGL